MNKEEITELENPYFDVQAEMGITKHAGGLSATKELLELCHVNSSHIYLLSGAAAEYLEGRE